MGRNGYRSRIMIYTHAIIVSVVVDKNHGIVASIVIRALINIVLCTLVNCIPTSNFRLIHSPSVIKPSNLKLVLLLLAVIQILIFYRTFFLIGIVGLTKGVIITQLFYRAVMNNLEII